MPVKFPHLFNGDFFDIFWHVSCQNDSLIALKSHRKEKTMVESFVVRREFFIIN